MDLHAYAPRPAHIKWLLDSDPSIRWQVMRDLIGAPPEAIAADSPRQSLFNAPSGLIHVTTMPLHGNGMVIGALSVYHDANFIERQSLALWRRALIGVVAQTLLIGCVTLLAIRWGVGRPLQKMAHFLRATRTGSHPTVPEEIAAGPEFEPLKREVTRRQVAAMADQKLEPTP